MEPDEQTNTEAPPGTEAEPVTEEMDLAPVEPPRAEPECPELAEPGMYRCVAENVGEHGVLGVLVYGEEYDYSATQDEATLAAVAACVDGGYLEKV